MKNNNSINSLQLPQKPFMSVTASLRPYQVNWPLFTRFHYTHPIRFFPNRSFHTPIRSTQPPHTPANPY